MNKRAQSSVPVEPDSLAEILQAMMERGDLEAAVLTSLGGLPIATVPPDYDSNVVAAMAALIQRVSNDAQTQLGMAEVDEVTIYDQERIRLVCRYLPAGGERLILAVVVPPERAYRRVTNWAVRRIERLLT